MVKKRGKVRKSLKVRVKEQERIIAKNFCRKSSGKSKASKVKKLMQIAKNNSAPKKKKKGFFSWLFGGK